jgi:hypothetical protein
VGGGLALVSGWALAIDHTGHHAGITSPAHLTICVVLALYVLFSPPRPDADTNMPDKGRRQISRRQISMDMQQSANDETTCYVIDGVVMDDQKVIICTSEPEEAAWDWGVHPSEMKETSAESLDRGECEETVSFQGTPEWLCTGSYEPAD